MLFSGKSVGGGSTLEKWKKKDSEHMLEEEQKAWEIIRQHLIALFFSLLLWENTIVFTFTPCAYLEIFFNRNIVKSRDIPFS